MEYFTIWIILVFAFVGAIVYGIKFHDKEEKDDDSK